MKTLLKLAWLVIITALGSALPHMTEGFEGTWQATIQTMVLNTVVAGSVVYITVYTLGQKEFVFGPMFAVIGPALIAVLAINVFRDYLYELPNEVNLVIWMLAYVGQIGWHLDTLYELAS